MPGPSVTLQHKKQFKFSAALQRHILVPNRQDPVWAVHVVAKVQPLQAIRAEGNSAETQIIAVLDIHDANILQRLDGFHVLRWQGALELHWCIAHSAMVHQLDELLRNYRRICERLTTCHLKVHLKFSPAIAMETLFQNIQIDIGQRLQKCKAKGFL